MRTSARRRRWLLGTLVVLVAAATVLGSGDGARAVDNGHKRPDYGSKLAFKLECELLGGTFSEDGIGNTYCHTPYGGVIECDANGNDCYYDPDGGETGSGEFPRPPLGPGTSITDGPALVLDAPDMIDAHPDRDRDQDRIQSKRNAKPGKHGKKRGKHHP